VLRVLDYVVQSTARLAPSPESRRPRRRLHRSCVVFYTGKRCGSLHVWRLILKPCGGFGPLAVLNPLFINLGTLRRHLESAAASRLVLRSCKKRCPPRSFSLAAAVVQHLEALPRRTFPLLELLSYITRCDHVRSEEEHEIARSDCRVRARALRNGG